MKLKYIKTEKISGNKIKPLFKNINSRNVFKLSRSPNSRNYISKLEQKKSINSQNFQTSITSIDNSNSFNELNKNHEEYDKYMLYKKYLISKTQYNKKISEIADISNKFIENNKEIEKLEKNLATLKQDKKEKQLVIIDLISKKESLEEIYKLKLFSLFKKTQNINNKKINGQIKENKNDIKFKRFTKNGSRNKTSNNNLNNTTKSINLDRRNKNNNLNNSNKTNIIKANKSNSNINKNNKKNGIGENNPFETINIINDDEIEINLDDIKISNQKAYEEQVINLAEEFLEKKDMELRNKLIEKIKFGYQIFFLETNSYTCIKLDNIISNFFSRASSIISKESNGKFSEKLINSFLKILLKLNIINDEMSHILKFLNKIYKNTKKEIKEKINNLNKKNENLKNKKISYENIKNELKKFIDENKNKVKNNEKNIINIGNDNRQYVSFMIDNHFQNELEFFNDGKVLDFCETERKKNDKMELEYSSDNIDNINNGQVKDKNSKKGLKIKKLNMNKLLKVNNNKITESCNGVNNLNNVIINYIPCDNKNKEIYENDEQNINNNSKEINVKNLLINNNIKIENNNNIINNNSGNNNNENNNNVNNDNNENNNNVNKDNNENNEDEKNKTQTNNEEKKYNIQNSPENKNIVVPKEIKFNSIKKIKIPHRTNQNIFHSPTNLKRNRGKNKLFSIDNQDLSNKATNMTPCKSLKYNDLQKTSDNINVSKSFSNNYINITHNIPQSFCYFKLSDKGDNKFNPSNSADMNPVKLNYYEGDILIDNIFNKLKLNRKTEKKFIGIDLKDIIGINLEKPMENIIKIYDMYVKSGKNKEENYDFNKYINSEEMKKVPIEENEKIEAINCKFFNLNIIINKRFIPKAEFIFNSLENFYIWYNCLNDIIKINNSDKEKNN